MRVAAGFGGGRDTREANTAGRQVAARPNFLVLGRKRRALLWRGIAIVVAIALVVLYIIAHQAH